MSSDPVVKLRVEMKTNPDMGVDAITVKVPEPGTAAPRVGRFALGDAASVRYAVRPV
jgi:hypothetical protein